MIAVGIGACFLQAGCAGDGQDAVIPSAYRGIWSGGWDSRDFNESGSMIITIYSDGSITGSFTNDRYASQAPINGLIREEGDFDASVGFGAEGNYQLSGRMATSGSDLLIGSFTITYKGVRYGAGCELGPGSGGGGGGAPSP